MHERLVPCPFVDGAGHRCKGHLIRIEEYYNSDIRWDYQPDGAWRFRLEGAALGEPGSLYRLLCSEKHYQMKVGFEELDDAVKGILSIR
jgi:hypothetical protein